MLGRNRGLISLFILFTSSLAFAQTDGTTTVSGIVTERSGKKVWLKAEEDDKPVAYTIGDDLDKKSQEALKAILTINRAKFTYKTKGDERQLVGVAKVATKREGTITGVVLSANVWWVEVKAKGAPAEGFAAHFPTDKHKPIMDKIKSLEKGDTVTLRYTTDSERHRIESLQKVASKK